MEEPRRGYIGNVLKESEQVRAREKEADPSHGCQLLSKRNYRNLPGRGLLCLVRRGQGQQGEAEQHQLLCATKLCLQFCTEQPHRDAPHCPVSLDCVGGPTDHVHSPASCPQIYQHLTHSEKQFPFALFRQLLFQLIINPYAPTSSDNRWKVTLDSGRHWHNHFTKWNCEFWERNMAA